MLMTISSKTKTGHLTRGFTLIELLVVIAIIGILSSVVLASLNTARNKGADAAVKGNLSGARAQAEIFYDTGATYDGVCAASGTSVVGPQILAGAKAVGITTVTLDSAAGSATNAVCNDTTTGWAAQVPLKTTGAGYFCVDNNGAATTNTTTMISSGSDYTCS